MIFLLRRAIINNGETLPNNMAIQLVAGSSSKLNSRVYLIDVANVPAGKVEAFTFYLLIWYC